MTDASTFRPLGLYYARNRWYSPELGRFITRDPNATAAPIVTATPLLDIPSFSPQSHYGNGLNLYPVAQANPVVRIDPLGLVWHHLYPLHLGGPQTGPGIELDHASHTAFHNALRDMGYGPGDSGRTAWATLNKEQQRVALQIAAVQAGIDIADPEFDRALDIAIADAEPGVGHKWKRIAMNMRIPVRRAPPGKAAQLVRGIPGLDKLQSAGNALSVLGGVLAAVSMWDALRIDNPYVRDMAMTTWKYQKTGQISLIDEVFILHDMYQLTHDPFAAMWGWEYWHSSIGL